MRLEDHRQDLPPLDDEVEKTFKEQYLAHLGGSPRFIRLESECGENQLKCTMLMSVVQECTRIDKDVPILSK